MKIEIVNDRNATNFGDLPYITIFSCDNGSGVFMSIPPCYDSGDLMNAVDLEDGSLTMFMSNEQVIPLPARLVIDWKHR